MQAYITIPPVCVRRTGRRHEPAKPGCTNDGFTLIELLVVVAIVAMLVAILVPSLGKARLMAKVTKVHSDLRTIGQALTMYEGDYNEVPPASAICMGQVGRYSQEDYKHLPVELIDQGYLPYELEDVFNEGRSYKYTAAGLGWFNLGMTFVDVWAPKSFPTDDGGELVPYSFRRPNPNWPDQPVSPVAWGLWSAGPSGYWDAYNSTYLPVPRRYWYEPRSANFDKDGELVRAGELGIIVRLSNGDSSWPTGR